MAVWIVSAILVAVLILLITEKLPVDLIAIGIMAALMVSGILGPREAVAGFANPAVVTVAAMFIISRGMIRTGALGFIAQRVIDLSKGNPNRAMILVLVIVATASAFVNNTPVVVLFIPIILNLSCEYGFSPSKFLIPISYASILAGTCTLIGTSTNIIIRDLSLDMGYGGIEMFELAILGVPIAAVGILFMIFAAPRIMPGHAAPTCEMENRENKKYLAELRVPADSALIGTDPAALLRERYPSFELFEIVRNDHIFYPDRDAVGIREGDVLLVKGAAGDFVTVLEDDAAELPHQDAALNYQVDDTDSIIVEMIIPPQSRLIGERLLDTQLARSPDINIIAIKSRHLHYSEQKIQRVRIRTGDIILARFDKNALDWVRGEGEVIIVEDVHHEILHKTKAKRAFTIFAGLILAASFGLADIMVCAVAAVFLMAVTGCIRLRDAYRELRGDVLLIIVGTIALGEAMQKTGASRIYAEAFLSLFQGAGPRVVLTGMLLFTSVSTQLLSNNATAVLLLPLAVSTAHGLAVDPKSFIIAVCFGASACFATPIGYQTNLLVYGPGAYRFSDYLKLGIPLNLIVLAMGAIFIPVFWPF
jgi:di/tricarboxylate transporter